MWTTEKSCTWLVWILKFEKHWILQSVSFNTIWDKFGIYHPKESANDFVLYNLNLSKMWMVAWSIRLTHLTCFFFHGLDNRDWPCFFPSLDSSSLHIMTTLVLWTPTHSSQIFISTEIISFYFIHFFRVVFMISMLHRWPFIQNFISSCRENMNGQRVKVHFTNLHQRSVWIYGPYEFQVANRSLLLLFCHLVFSSCPFWGCARWMKKNSLLPPPPSSTTSSTLGV